MVPPLDLAAYLSPESVGLLTANGVQLVRRLGPDVLRGVVLDVLSGRNLRDSTEKLTRRRITSLNLNLVELFLRREAADPGFVARLPEVAEQLLAAGGLDRANRWLALWVLGLTDKAFQNVLKDDTAALAAYRQSYVRICGEVVAERATDRTVLSGRLAVGGVEVPIDWRFLAYLLNTVGAQTLAIRGSEKSAYGKLFEKLILGAVLSVLGFRLTTDPPTEFDRVFWFTSADEKRESDATLLFELGKGVPLDIGFIGRGNSEISLDKVSRFERTATIGRKKTTLSTIIIVDRIGPRSRLPQLAAKIKGTVIQMSASYWVQDLARQLAKTHKGYTHPLVAMDLADVHGYLQHELERIDLNGFLSLADPNGDEPLDDEEG